MSQPPPTLPAATRVVLVDANVLFSRVLRDYLLYAAEQEIVSVAWSQAILDETKERLVSKLSGFTSESARRLMDALAQTFPDAIVEPTTKDYARLEGIALPDEDDRHVIAAALAADAHVICTDDTKGFRSPERVQTCALTR